ncbi:DsrE family protein [Nocardioides sp. NPDC023903]|uniref:DsrE family protein n=1 Tax=Nocardioides sp. NPDC023903 TaxID=3157195 RepID=UPI0033F95E49
MQELVVKVTVGAEAPERTNQAFTVASAAATAGAKVSLWLTGEATWFAVPGRAEEFKLENAAPLQELIGLVIEAGQVTVCSQCASRRDLSEDDLIDGVTIKGAVVFAEEILRDGVQALVY